MVTVPTMSSSDTAKDKTFTIHTSTLFDSKTKTWLKNRSITIDPTTGLITSVYTRTKTLPTTLSPPDIDLRNKLVLPGLVDAHTHLLLHSYSETPSLSQMRDESFVERIVRATNHCRAALLAGYTTYRDLGTEGAYDADVHIRDCVNRGIVPGPRIFCATEALASSGGYEIRQENEFSGARVPRISDPCDGVDGCRAAVRRRLGAGADVVKSYADYRRRELRFPQGNWPGCPGIQFPPPGGLLEGQRNPNLLLFTQEEMDAIVSEARVGRAPVAAHASTAEGVAMAARAGVTSVEHGFESFEGTEAIRTMKENGTIFVPTLAVIEKYLPLEPILAQTKAVFDASVKLACGGDTGAFPHGDNAREVELFVEAGIPIEETLAAATLGGWKVCGGEWCGRKFGWVGEGWAADLVAVKGEGGGGGAGFDAEAVKNGALRDVEFVMKDGRVWKRDGKAMGMV